MRVCVRACVRVCVCVCVRVLDIKPPTWVVRDGWTGIISLSLSLSLSLLIHSDVWVNPCEVIAFFPPLVYLQTPGQHSPSGVMGGGTSRPYWLSVGLEVDWLIELWFD